MSYALIAIFGFVILWLLFQCVKARLFKSAKRAVIKKIKNVADDFEVVDLESKLQKAEEKLHKAKDKLIKKSEE